MEILSLECKQVEGTPNLDGPALLINATPLRHGGGFDLMGRCKTEKKGLLGEPRSIFHGLSLVAVQGQTEIVAAVNLARASGRLIFDDDVVELEPFFVVHFHAVVTTGIFSGPLMVHCTTLQHVSNVVWMHLSR